MSAEAPRSREGEGRTEEQSSDGRQDQGTAADRVRSRLAEGGDFGLLGAPAPLWQPDAGESVVGAVESVRRWVDDGRSHIFVVLASEGGRRLTVAGDRMLCLQMEQANPHRGDVVGVEYRGQMGTAICGRPAVTRTDFGTERTIAPERLPYESYRVAIERGDS